MAEWLGRGLQNLVQRFESASDLQDFDERLNYFSRFFCFITHYLPDYPRKRFVTGDAVRKG